MNIVFLDVDGVMIPGRSYIGAPEPLSFDPIAVQIVKAICWRCAARIVFNSVWSGMRKNDLKMEVAKHDLVFQLFDERMEDSTTAYPYHSDNRLEAGLTWLQKHNLSETKFVFLDDALIEDEAAVIVNPENGISVDDYRKATTILGNPDEFMIFL